MTDLYAAQYPFPQAVENLRRKMRQLEQRAHDLGDKEAAAIIGAANAAWTDAETKAVLARIEKRMEAAGGN